jgi:hypothetical protein
VCQLAKGKLIDELCHDSTFSELPSMSQEVNIYTQDSDDDQVGWEGRFTNDTAALQSRKEEEGGVAGALIPLCKELMCSVEKASFLFPQTCEQLRTIIASLNKEEDGRKNEGPSHSLALPLSKNRKKRKPAPQVAGFDKR